MSVNDLHKPEFDDWLYWSNVIIDRLTTCIYIYSKPPHEDLFMPEKERQHRNGHTINLRTRIHALIDETETPSDSLTELDHHAERVIDGLALLFKETLDHLPELSLDMQKLLKTTWNAKSTGDRRADELFHGPLGNEQEGIGSGLPEHGHLPAVIAKMLETEHAGDTRAPRQELLGSTPHRADKDGRWAASNSHILRSAGRID